MPQRRFVPLVLLVTFSVGCDAVRESADSGATAQVTPTSSRVRAARRMYNGAPPVIPHKRLKITCTECHTQTGKASPPLGMAPANPHSQTPGLGALGNCMQCHVFRDESPPLAESDFVGLSQRLAQGDRLYRGAPPVVPHRIFMREDCSACHAGPAARPEIRCSHPLRSNCRQCHVPARSPSDDELPLGLTVLSADL